MNDALIIRYEGEIVAVYCATCAKDAYVSDDEVATWQPQDRRTKDLNCDTCAATIPSKRNKPQNPARDLTWIDLDEEEDYL